MPAGPVHRHAVGEAGGHRLSLTPDELAAADAYETDDYVRVSVALRSGGRAWAYVAAASV